MSDLEERLVEEKMDLQEYITAGVEKIVKNAVKVTLTNPAQSMFMARFAAASRAASGKRKVSEKAGEHIPAFLIASITSSCNLHCAGYYARAVHSCTDTEPAAQLTAEEWDSVFQQAEEMGISFILLAGGEPMIRRDVLEKAGSRQNILFPIFTNGTLVNDTYIRMLKKCRNLVPVFSIEGKEMQTNARRGEGIYEKVLSAMDKMQKEKLMFGSSVTVTKENLEEIRNRYPDMIFLSFQGDEKASGGCIAAGRGFFHINSHGGAEPCPFSPYSDVNVKDTSLRAALHSRLFAKLQDSGTLTEEHAGGCVLFENRDEVESYLDSEQLRFSTLFV